MQWVTFAPLSDFLVDHYKKTAIEIDTFSLVYMIVYPFVNFPSSYIIDNVSIRLGVNKNYYYSYQLQQLVIFLPQY